MGSGWTGWMWSQHSPGTGPEKATSLCSNFLCTIKIKQMFKTKYSMNTRDMLKTWTRTPNTEIKRTWKISSIIIYGREQ